MSPEQPSLLSPPPRERLTARHLTSLLRNAHTDADADAWGVYSSRCIARACVEGMALRVLATWRSGLDERGGSALPCLELRDPLLRDPDQIWRSQPLEDR